MAALETGSKARSGSSSGIIIFSCRNRKIFFSRWLTCSEMYKNACWDGSKENCTYGCLSNTEDISAILHWKLVYLKVPALLDENMLGLYPPILFRWYVVIFIWFFSFIILSLYLRNMEVLVKITYTFNILLIVILSVVTITSGGLQGMSEFFYLNKRSLISLDAWSRAFHMTVDFLALGRGMFILYGCSLQSNHSAAIISCASVFHNFCYSVVCILIVYGCYGVVLKAANVKPNSGFNPYQRFSPVMYGLIPQALQFVGTPHLWTIVFFVCLFLILISSQIILLLAVEKCMMDSFNTLIRYKRYFMAIFSFTASLISGAILSGPMYVMVFMLSVHFPRAMENTCLFFMSILVFYVYGYQNFSDDVHFFTGSQPTKFWKTMWCISPVFLFMAMYYTQIEPLVVRRGGWKRFFIHTLMPLPILIGWIYEVFKYIERQDLIGILKPEERWGPADPEERHLRRLFNPRQETRSRRRKEVCLHRCLVDSRVIKKAIEEEETFRKTN